MGEVRASGSVVAEAECVSRCLMRAIDAWELMNFLIPGYRFCGVAYLLAHQNREYPGILDRLVVVRGAVVDIGLVSVPVYTITRTLCSPPAMITLSGVSDSSRLFTFLPGKNFA